MLLTTPEEDAKVEELRAKLPETSSIRPPNDMCVRFLRARSLNVDKAADLLAKHLLWLERVKPLEIAQSEIHVPLHSGSMCMLGVNKYGNPVMFGSSRGWNPHEYSLDTCVKFMTYYLSRTEAICEMSGAQQFVLLFDVSYWALWHTKYLSYSTQLMKIMQDHFPERLRNAFVINAPAFFQTFYRLAKSMMDAKTASKLHFVTIPKGHSFVKQPPGGEAGAGRVTTTTTTRAKSGSNSTTTTCDSSGAVSPSMDDVSEQPLLYLRELSEKTCPTSYARLAELHPKSGRGESEPTSPNKNNEGTSTSSAGENEKPQPQSGPLKPAASSGCSTSASGSTVSTIGASTIGRAASESSDPSPVTPVALVPPAARSSARSGKKPNFTPESRSTSASFKSAGSSTSTSVDGSGTAATPASNATDSAGVKAINTSTMAGKLELFTDLVPIEILPQYYGGVIEENDVIVPNLPGQKDLENRGPWKHSTRNQEK